jgi:hypothetical protein
MAPPIPTSETQHQLPMQTRATPYLSFEELLLDPKFGFLKGLASVMQVTEAAKVCQGVVKIFLKHDRAVELIRALIINEVGSQSAYSQRKFLVVLSLLRFPAPNNLK